ncbi:MAG: branched-chain amino acid ABC transporter permease [Dehalococcoidia bacterium]|nr:MAG: branched-chain amino acid ABC transporter permease [Dehalococcoidia bacterium]
MIYFAQYVCSGILLGLLYSMVALGLTVVYRSGRIINLAQGELVIVGGFLIWWFIVMTPLPQWWMGIIIAFALMGLLGLVIERAFFRPLIGQPIFSLVMMTIGLLLLLRGVVIATFGAKERPFPQIFSAEPVVLGPFSFDSALFWGGIIALLIVLALAWFFERTKYGLRFSAVAEDHQVAQSMGISVKQSVAVAWVLATILGGFASIVFFNGKIVTFLASEIGFRALPVALLAGLESVRGVLVAGIIVGIGEMLAMGYLNPITNGGMANIFPYIVMIVVVLFKPQGLYGWRVIERV